MFHFIHSWRYSHSKEELDSGVTVSTECIHCVFRRCSKCGKKQSFNCGGWEDLPSKHALFVKRHYEERERLLSLLK